MLIKCRIDQISFNQLSKTFILVEDELRIRETLPDLQHQLLFPGRLRSSLQRPNSPTSLRKSDGLESRESPDRKNEFGLFQFGQELCR